MYKVVKIPFGFTSVLWPVWLTLCSSVEDTVAVGFDSIGSRLRHSIGHGDPLFAAVSYGIASMAMVFINKAVLMQYAHSMTLLTLQVTNTQRLVWTLVIYFLQLATTMLIHFGRSMGYTKARGVDVTTAKRLLPVSIFYNANVAFALASLKGVNIPMYIAIKRLTPLAVLIAGFFYGKGRPTMQVNLLKFSYLPFLFCFTW
ncbi:hypothetical protein Ahy_A08g040723 isoform C [Arachis hypogaea]|uniref:Sugar phosphate transporter domain-containing protein n=1 Tax=Arachis hypogaea TaxID=3818 RepID=A0A445C0K1_ARAHY|nr:hypothetical protein Ahy_A08g040723 isoform C [Arachis hypogaea]